MARHPPTGILGKAFLGALNAIQDDYNYGRAARAILDRNLVPGGTVVAVLDHAQGAVESEGSPSDLLLFSLDRHPPEGAPEMPVFGRWTRWEPSTTGDAWRKRLLRMGLRGPGS